MFNHNVYFYTNNGVYYLRLNIDHMIELANVSLFLNMAWMQTVGDLFNDTVRTKSTYLSATAP
jgi:hypothetical protein